MQAYDHEDPYLAVARWMQELGHRRTGSLPPVQVRNIEAPRRSTGRIGYQALALTALLSAYFQYYFLDVLVQIETVRSIIVFVFTG